MKIEASAAQEPSPPVTRHRAQKRKKIHSITAGKCNVEHVYCKRKINEKVTVKRSSEFNLKKQLTFRERYETGQKF